MDYILKQENIFMKCESSVKKKLAKLILDGASRLQLVADFDRTISLATHNGKKVPTSFSVFQDDEKAPEEFRKRTMVLRNKYYPIESSQTLTTEEKIPFMIKWYNEKFELMLESGVKQGEIPEMVSRSNMMIRSKISQLFQFLESQDIPVLVYSAGLGNVVKATLEQQNAWTTNVYVVSNFIKFDSETRLPEIFKGEILHPYNKSGIYPEAAEYYNSANIRNRSNAILLGDSIGDCTMTDGGSCFENKLPDESTILRIAFLDDKVEENLPLYLENFDIVLTNDQTGDVVWKLFKLICADTVRPFNISLDSGLKSQ